MTLQEAAKANNFQAVKRVLPGYKGERIPNVRDEEDRSALDYAVMNNNLEMIEYLLSLGSNVNSIDSQGRSRSNYKKFTLLLKINK